MNLKATYEVVAWFELHIRELLAQGVPVEEAVRRAYALYPVMKVMADEVQAQIVAEAVRGYGGALPEGGSDCLFTHSWAPDKLTLSERTTRGGLLVRALVAQAITQQLKKGATYRRTARTIFDGYKKGGLIPEQDLPKFLQEIVAAGRRADIPRAKLLNMLKPVKKEIAKRTTAGMRAAYTQLVRAVEAQNEKALENAIYVATQERTRYFAERIARTEMARAYHDGFLARWDANEDCIAYQWRLSGRHPVYDICDLYAKANLYGLGAGIFPKGKVPLIPAHPNCMCSLKPVIRGMLDNETPHERIEDGGMEYLRSVNPYQRRLLLGVHGARAVMEGKVSWTELARGYGGKKVDSRLSSEIPSSDIIKKKDFADLQAYIGKLDNKTVREWYVHHDNLIHTLISKELPMEEKARRAFELRNQYRRQARDLMADQTLRRQLDREKPMKEWEVLISEKMEKKNMSRNEAIEDTYKTSIKSNEGVNKRLGLE